MKNLITYFVVSIILFTGKSIQAQHSPLVYDIIVCLDDRITVDNQINRDKEIIKIIFNDFRKLVKQTRFYINSNDAFRILIAPQAGTSNEIYGMSRILTIDLARLGIAQKRAKMDEFEENLDERINELYQLADKGSQKSNYNGTNIWRYFNGNYQAELRSSATQKVFILTDGYIDFENEELSVEINGKTNHTKFVSELMNNPNWPNHFSSENLGIIPCNIDLSSTEIYVLEVNPKSGGYFEGEILEKVWLDWLTEMGSQKVKVIQRTSSIPDIVSMAY